jgi:diguanylate cyclase (GGDEF)-like protein
VRSTDEVGQLASSFNEMTERLSAHIAKLNESREDLKRALTRFADALRSTHDLDRMLELVLDTSVDTMMARAGTLMWMSPGRDRLKVTASRGVDGERAELDVGEGIAGTVALVGEPVMIPANGEGAEVPIPSPKEPGFKTAISVPIVTNDRPVAVISLFDKEDDEAFTSTDLETLQSLARQAGVHVENVLLHQEARRQAIMDSVVGTWNRRYFDIRLGQEMDRSRRTHRPFSVIMLDIDDFKKVNDAWGHQRGDGVLIELAGRVRSTIRDIDVLARYGGEEFVLILPETDLDGAMQTAEKIRSIVAEASFAGEPTVEITVSLGVSCFPQHGEDPLKAADQAMYAAKAAGKNCVRQFQPDLAA